MVSSKKNSKIKTKNITFSEKKDNATDNKVTRRKLSSRRVSKTSIINNKKVLREKKSDIDNNKNWSWAHSIMILTVTLCNIYNIKFKRYI